MSHNSFDQNRRKFLSTSMIAASGAVAAGVGLLTPRNAAADTGTETPQAVLQAVIGYPNEKGVQIQRVTYPNRSA
jgi:hypothetical protein